MPLCRNFFHTFVALHHYNLLSKPESIRNTEVDFLFDLLDYNDDDIIDKGDFKPNSKFN